MDKAPALGRRDWVVGAMEMLAEKGIDGVKVDKLADRMKVTRGSFYWHFKSRADLLDAMLDFWQQELTDDLISRAAGHASPAERLRSVAVDALERRSFGLDVHRVEEALRFWAATDPAAAPRMRAVDAIRTSYITRELVDLGQSSDAAQRHAKLLYLTLIGLFTARAYNEALADDSAYFALVDLVIGS